jgi:hypothetical protein
MLVPHLPQLLLQYGVALDHHVPQLGDRQCSCRQLYSHVELLPVRHPEELLLQLRVASAATQQETTITERLLIHERVEVSEWLLHQVAIQPEVYGAVSQQSPFQEQLV